MRGILFDFNGTLLFDSELQNECWREFLEKKIGREVTNEEFHEHMHGVNADEALSYFFQRKVSRAEAESLEEEKEIIYRARCLKWDGFHLAEGLPNFLDALKKNKIPFTIATASALPNVKFFFEHLDLGKWFKLDYVVYNDGTIIGKPAPDMYLKAAEVLGVNISDSIIFEDSRIGIKAARHAHPKKIIGVASMASAEDLIGYGAAAAISDYKDLDSLMKIVTEGEN